MAGSSAAGGAEGEAPGGSDPVLSRLLGATFIAERSLGERRWTVMADPEGSEFCVSGA